MNRRRLPVWRAVLILFAATVSSPVGACALEGLVTGGFTVSHPRALDVAIAVAKARREGLLSSAAPTSLSDDARLRLMITDMRRLQLRLDRARSALVKGSGPSFSVVLVGPGLWSHFHQSSGGLLARYHAEGPLADRVVVITHHAVLEALLRGELSAEAAAARGLIAFAGDDANPVQQMFERGFDARA